MKIPMKTKSILTGLKILLYVNVFIIITYSQCNLSNTGSFQGTRIQRATPWFHVLRWGFVLSIASLPHEILRHGFFGSFFNTQKGFLPSANYITTSYLEPHSLVFTHLSVIKSAVFWTTCLQDWVTVSVNIWRYVLLCIVCINQ